MATQTAGSQRCAGQCRAGGLENGLEVHYGVMGPGTISDANHADQLDMPELLTTLSEIEERVRGLDKNRKGIPALGTDYVLDNLVLPLLALARSGARWVTRRDAERQISKALGRTISENYLSAELRMLGGRSRLKMWEEQGLAYRSEDGIWLISEFAILAVRKGAGTRAATDPLDPDAAAAALYDEAA